MRLPTAALFVGIDLGTSGCRALAIDADGRVHAHSETAIPDSVRGQDGISQRPADWWAGLCRTLQDLTQRLSAQDIAAVCIDSTSGTLLLADAQGQALTPALMYNDRRPDEIAQRLGHILPATSGAHGVSSGLAKLLWWQDQGLPSSTHHALHAADWLSGRLTARWGISDGNNALKLGFDPLTQTWPDAITRLIRQTGLLPTVRPPGSVIGEVCKVAAEATGLRPGTPVHAGTTDGVAAALAAGLQRPGDGMTALGSTLVIKLLSTEPVFAPEYGVYSHRLGDYWLPGGASNSGGAALARYMDLAEIHQRSPQLVPDRATGLDYYPLPDRGERFPVCDPGQSSRAEPVPEDRTEFLQGLMEGVASIEAQAYGVLSRLGAPKLQRLFSTGAGSANPNWRRIREHTLGITIQPAVNQHAAYGAARLGRGDEIGRG